MNEEQFRHFVEQYKDIIWYLIESGALEVRNGRAFLDFNDTGTLMSVKIERKIYQRGIDTD